MIPILSISTCFQILSIYSDFIQRIFILRLQASDVYPVHYLDDRFLELADAPEKLEKVRSASIV